MDATSAEAKGDSPNTTEPVLTSYYFTFGCGSPLAKYYVEIKASDELHARAKMVAMFSSHWASVYTAPKFVEILAREDLVKLHINRSATVRLRTNHDDLPLELYRMAFHED